jgi:hypothetical protein
VWTTFQIKLALRFRVFGVYHVMKDAVECDRTGNLSSTIGGRLAATGCRRPPYLEPAFLDLNDGSKEMDDLILTSYIIRSAAQPLDISVHVPFFIRIRCGKSWRHH